MVFFSFITLSEGTLVGQRIYSGSFFDNNLSNNKSSSFCLRQQALFSVVCNVESYPYMGSALARAAGSGAVIIASSSKLITLKLKSGWFVNVSPSAIASVGYISNILHTMQILGKAGKNKGKGKRPVVRGVAMNPCDHPHGGGNGKSSPPALPLTPWGKATKWVHTKNRKEDNKKRFLYKIR